MFFMVSMLSSFLAALFRPRITPIKPGAAAINAVVPGQQGAMADYAALTNILSALSVNGSPSFGNFSTTLIPNNVAARTYSGSEMVSGIIRRFDAAAATVDCTDTATNIVAAIPGAVPLQTFPMMVAALGASPLTIAAGAGVTMAGTNVIGGFSMRLFLGQVLGSSAVTLTPLFSLPLRSNL